MHGKILRIQKLESGTVKVANSRASFLRLLSYVSSLEGPWQLQGLCGVPEGSVGVLGVQLFKPVIRLVFRWLYMQFCCLSSA